MFTHLKRLAGEHREERRGTSHDGRSTGLTQEYLHPALKSAGLWGLGFCALLKDVENVKVVKPAAGKPPEG